MQGVNEELNQSGVAVVFVDGDIATKLSNIAKLFIWTSVSKHA
jgi:hypothetical protein